MYLSWRTDYRDFADTEHWVPRCIELEKTFLQISLETISAIETKELLDIMEQMSELMIYYVTIENMEKLEPVMRIQEQMLQVCKDRGVSYVGYFYLEMMFARINGLLYQSYHKNRQAVECYHEFIKKAELCFQAVKMDFSLSIAQKLYVGWSCAEGYKAAAAAERMLLNNKEVFNIYRSVLQILAWIETYMQEFPGICDKVADFYALIASEFYLNQQREEGAKYYEKTISILQNIYLKDKNDFYFSKIIWYYSTYGIAEFSNSRGSEKMLEAAKRAAEFLKTRNPQGREKGIVEGALGMTALQQGMLLQQSNKPSEAVECLTESKNNLKKALYLLEMELLYKDKIGYEASIIKDMALKVYSSYTTSQYLLGIQYYLCKQLRQSSDIFTAVLASLTNEKKYRLSTVEAMMLRADINQYLAKISIDERDKSRAEFYSTQAADLSLELAQEMGYAFAWGIHISSCMMAAEIYLNMGNRDKASEYADKGILACEILKQIEPAHPKLIMKKSLSKLKAKANRKFFWQ